MTFTKLTLSDLDMAEADGDVIREGSVTWVHRPRNPGYYWGNYALLSSAPEADDLERLIAANKGHFEGVEGIRHVLLRWDGAAASEATITRAKALGMSVDGGIEMWASALSDASHMTCRRSDLLPKWQL